MTSCFFISDIHGFKDRYDKLFKKIIERTPDILFMGGDILPNGFSGEWKGVDFLQDYFINELTKLKNKLRDKYPLIFIILGNDDPKINENFLIEKENLKLWKYIHNRSFEIHGFKIYGYSFIPPTPFRLKDWEKYDVSMYVDPGCTSPEEGSRSVPVSNYEKKYTTIKKDLDDLITEKDLSRTIILFHSPPYKSMLDRAALDGKFYDHVPLDVHVGSIAIQRFIEKRSPYLTLHGHIHESSEITGSYMDRSNNTIMLNAAYSGKSLSLITFNLEDLSSISRELI